MLFRLRSFFYFVGGVASRRVRIDVLPEHWFWSSGPPLQVAKPASNPVAAGASGNLESTLPLAVRKQPIGHYLERVGDGSVASGNGARVRRSTVARSFSATSEAMSALPLADMCP